MNNDNKVETAIAGYANANDEVTKNRAWEIEYITSKLQFEKKWKLKLWMLYVLDVSDVYILACPVCNAK